MKKHEWRSSHFYLKKKDGEELWDIHAQWNIQLHWECRASRYWKINTFSGIKFVHFSYNSSKNNSSTAAWNFQAITTSFAKTIFEPGSLYTNLSLMKPVWTNPLWSLHTCFSSCSQYTLSISHQSISNGINAKDVYPI